MMNFNYYTDGPQREFPEIPLNEKLNEVSLYKPSKGLQDAVNVALALGQPLLVTGEPGTGKTQLAEHVAWHFKLGEPLVLRCQSISTATDLFYKYDALGHFQYAQTNKQVLTDDEVERDYIRYQALGYAIRSGKRHVVLIDEIDKAPRDLPNDLLNAIDKLEFEVPMIHKPPFKTTTEGRPIVIITSNLESNLPDAFLRRVAYYNIPFPETKQLMDILAAKIEGFQHSDYECIVDHFEKIRAAKVLRKDPATAELLLWAMLLYKTKFDTSKLKNTAGLTTEDQTTLFQTYSVLAKTKEDLANLFNLARGGKGGMR